MTEEDIKSDFYSAIRTALVSEIQCNELRARRSLRVLQHQEERLSTLENELIGKSNLLRDMQESHTDLLEAYHYQTEVQDLQKQLIKMQEIQYLNEFIRANGYVGGGGGGKSSTIDVNGNESEKLGSSLQPSTRDLDDKGKFSLQNNSRTGLCKTFPAEGSRDSDDDIRKTKSASDKTEEAALPAVDENRMFGLLRSISGSGDRSLPQKSSIKDSKYSNESPSSSGGNDSKTNYFAGFKSKNENRSTRDNENVEKLGNDSQQLSPSFYDDGDEKISILKETLSSHRQSIEDLSTEVVQLRKERAELLTYIQNLLEHKNKTEDMLNNLPESKDSVAEMLSRKELNFIMPVSENHCKAIYSDYDNQTQIVQPPQSNKRSKSRHVTINVVRCNSDSSGDGDATNYQQSGGSRLEERARRMWETACRFFTPQQAHFILTAPVPSDNEEEESAMEDNLPYY